MQGDDRFVNGKADYVPWIRRWSEPDLKKEAGKTIRRKYAHGYRMALECMAMHQITGDAEYAQLARELMDVTLDNYRQAANLSELYLLQLARYITWLTEPQSPYAPPNAEKRYRKIFYPFAAKPHEWHLGA